MSVQGGIRDTCTSLVCLKWCLGYSVSLFGREYQSDPLIEEKGKEEIKYLKKYNLQ